MKERFLKKVKKTLGCWEWTANKDFSGYGTFRVGNKIKKAHRVAYMLYVGEIPKGKNVCHKCDNPGCVNPKHLWIGTQQENMIDCVKKKRHQNQILKEEEIPIIRELYKKGESQRVLGEKFGVARETIKNVVTGKRWSYV